MDIFLFSKPIRSGKTTALMHWCSQKTGVSGILMPDINGRRNFFDLDTRTTFLAECDNPGQTNEALINMGRFYFYRSAFEKANVILLEGSSKKAEWLIIDEVGRMELEGKGVYPALEIILNKKECRNLVLVVRDSLIDTIPAFLKLKDHKIIGSPDEL
jgi:nucleoside-triphosphatase